MKRDLNRQERIVADPPDVCAIQIVSYHILVLEIEKGTTDTTTSGKPDSGSL